MKYVCSHFKKYYLQFIKLDYFYISIGIYSHELTVHINVFEHYNTVNDFQVRLRITATNMGDTGFTIINLLRNTPPYKKNATAPCCTVDPPTGIATQTLFTIECEDFKDDDDDIVAYSVACKLLTVLTCKAFHVNCKRFSCVHLSCTAFHNLSAMCIVYLAKTLFLAFSL